MEGVGQLTYAQDAGPEVLNKPVNFLELYGDRVCSFGGVTGTLKDMGDLCPIDLTDPSNLDAVNTFVVKLGNESGMEINPEHEKEFARVIEQTGAERKFVVAAESKSPGSEPKAEKATVEQQDKLPAVRPEDIKTVKSLNTKEREISMRETESIVPASIIAAIKARQIQEVTAQEQGKLKAQEPENIVKINLPKLTDTHNTLPNQVKKAIVTKAVIPVKIMNVIKTSVDNHLTQIDPAPVQELVIVDAKQDNIVPVESHTEPRAESVIDDIFATQERPVNETAQIKEMDEFVQEDFDTIFDQMIDSFDFTESVSEGNVETVLSGSDEWGELLFESPDAMFDYFVSGLESFAEKTTQFDIQDTEITLDSVNEFSEASPATYENKIAPILQLVVDKLVHLEDKSKATEQIQNIVGAIHGIRLLEERGAELPEIELLKTQLVELSAELFQKLGIEYDVEMVKIFVWTLLRPEYYPLQAGKESKKHQKIGTRESKQEPNQYFDPSFPDLNPGHYILGGLAVLYTTVLSDLYAPVLA